MSERLHKKRNQKYDNEHQKLSTRALLRIRYYELKIQLSDLGWRILDFLDKITCYQLALITPQNDTTCPSRFNDTHVDNICHIRSSKPQACKNATSYKSLVGNNIHECCSNGTNNESEVEPGEIRTKSQACTSQRISRRKSFSLENIDCASQRRKRRSSLTRNSGLNDESCTIILSSKKSAASGDAKLDEKESKQEIETSPKSKKNKTKLKFFKFKSPKNKSNETNSMSQNESESAVDKKEDEHEQDQEPDTIEDKAKEKDIDNPQCNPKNFQIPPGYTPHVPINAYTNNEYLNTPNNPNTVTGKGFIDRLMGLTNRRRRPEVVNMPPKFVKLGFKMDVPKGNIRQNKSEITELNPGEIRNRQFHSLNQTAFKPSFPILSTQTNANSNYLTSSRVNGTENYPKYGLINGYQMKTSTNWTQGTDVYPQISRSFTTYPQKILSDLNYIRPRFDSNSNPIMDQFPTTKFTESFRHNHNVTETNSSLKATENTNVAPYRPKTQFTSQFYQLLAD